MTLKTEWHFTHNVAINFSDTVGFDRENTAIKIKPFFATIYALFFKAKSCNSLNCADILALHFSESFQNLQRFFS